MIVLLDMMLMVSRVFSRGFGRLTFSHHQLTAIFFSPSFLAKILAFQKLKENPFFNETVLADLEVIKDN